MQYCIWSVCVCARCYGVSGERTYIKGKHNHGRDRLQLYARGNQIHISFQIMCATWCVVRIEPALQWKSQWIECMCAHMCLCIYSALFGLLISRLVVALAVYCLCLPPPLSNSSLFHTHFLPFVSGFSVTQLRLLFKIILSIKCIQLSVCVCCSCVQIRDTNVHC